MLGLYLGYYSMHYQWVVNKSDFLYTHPFHLSLKAVKDQ